VIPEPPSFLGADILPNPALVPQRSSGTSAPPRYLFLRFCPATASISPPLARLLDVSRLRLPHSRVLSTMAQLSPQTVISKPRPVITSEARDLLFLRANAIFPSSPNKSLRQIPNSRYNRRVDNYAKAPHRRLFHFPDPSSFDRSPSNASRPVHKLLILNDLRTLEISPAASHSFLSTSALLTKHRGVYPKLPILEHPVAAIVSQIAGLFPRPWQVLVRPIPCTSSRWPESRPSAGMHAIDAARFSLARKKRFPSHWARSTETQPLPTPFTQVFRYTVPIFRRLIDEARAFSR
jgi:hypothetical protein